MRWVTVVLALLIAAVQAHLWLGKGSLPQVWRLQGQLQEQQQRNEAARLRNARTAAEVGDLKEGLEMIEDRARSELGMVRSDEILIQLARPR